MSKYDYKNDAEDKWFKWQDKTPPERNPHLTEEELDQAFAENLANHKCEWTQRGNEIFCDTGDFEHGKRIGTKLRLAGTEANGQPLLVPMRAILRSEVDNG